MNTGSTIEQAAMSLRMTIRCQSDNRREQNRSGKLAG